MLKELVRERLIAVADEIFGLFEKTIASYEEELCQKREEIERQRQQLEAVSKTPTLFFIQGVQPLIGYQVPQLPPQLQGVATGLEHPQPPRVKEEEVESDVTAVPVKCEDEPPKSPMLPHSSDPPQHMTTKTNEDHRGAQQADRRLAPMANSNDTKEPSRSSTDSEGRLEADTGDMNVLQDGKKELKRTNIDKWANVQKMRWKMSEEYMRMKNHEHALRLARKMGMPCQSPFCQNSSKLLCRLVVQSRREEIYRHFWNELDWSGKGNFVKSLVEISSVKRPKMSDQVAQSRRGVSISCHLVVDGRRVRVCQRMFLSTLGISQWFLLKWAGRKGKGRRVVCPNTTVTTAKSVTKEDRSFLRFFLHNLPQVPSHYGGPSSSKVYLEPIFKSAIHLYNFYMLSCRERGVLPLSKRVLNKTLKDLNLTLFRAKREQCSTCSKTKDVDTSVWEEHRRKKDSTLLAMQQDQERAGREILVACMDLQGLLLAPKLQPSALHYTKTKLCVHNFTLFKMASQETTNYLWHEGEAGISQDELASCVVDFLLTNTANQEYILWSNADQYRNLVLSNALLKFATDSHKPVTQKFLERGHTRTECDAVHTAVRRRLKKRDIHVPLEYAAVIGGPGTRACPVKYVDHNFFTDYRQLNLSVSIQPSGDASVEDVRAIRYNTDGTMAYKLDHFEEWQPYASPLPRMEGPVGTVSPLYRNRQKLSSIKFQHLQELKHVLPQDYHSFYDTLDHE
ncbi:uncharacterized protein LOC133400154 isoform X1 [Phycodurus eques]|uniref:uncharacterized protein LOC133400154 isoform X1 n=1 Tax=Phycodurus eques TaxID=693459 RepID=UPI002ACE2A0E|nr:uncharacterized protein LOC133400154 isoform X1 [Phycodurus eques]